MFVYLTKKIALANQKKIYVLSWSHQYGYIACGADNGLLKVLKLDDQTPAAAAAASEKETETNQQPKFLSVNQTLEGHSNSVIHLSWNDKYQKLITSDINGLIIVWMFYKGNYYEEMINNRNRSVVIEVKWTNSGLLCCLIRDSTHQLFKIIFYLIIKINFQVIKYVLFLKMAQLLLALSKVIDYGQKRFRNQLS